MAQIASTPTFSDNPGSYRDRGIEAVSTLKSKPARRPLPKHLPRDRVEHAATVACPACGGTRLSLIGTDEREVLEYVPSHFRVVVHVRPKLACRDCETITQKPMPSLPIERGRPGPGLLAHVLVGRYCKYLPLYHQSAFYAHKGVEIDRSTLSDWVGAMADLLTPLAEAIVKHVRAGVLWHSDNNRPLPALQCGREKARNGYLQVMVRDERRLGSNVPPAVCYHYFSDSKEQVLWLGRSERTTRKQLETSSDAIVRTSPSLILGKMGRRTANSDTGGVRAATLHTLIETAKINGFDPETYLHDIINCIPAHPINRISELLPWNYYRS